MKIGRGICLFLLNCVRIVPCGNDESFATGGAGQARSAHPQGNHRRWIMTNALMNSLMPERNPNVPDLEPGDTVRVHQRIREGRNERIQIFQGVVISVKGGRTPGATYTVRRIASDGVGVERTFPLYSKTVEKVEVLRKAKVRRAKLYYLRERQGKAARLKEKRFLKA